MTRTPGGRHSRPPRRSPGSRSSTVSTATGPTKPSRGCATAALACFRRAAELDAFREKTRVAIVECLVRTGARRAARVEYESLVALLKKELDVEPLPETVADVRRLLGTSALPGGEDDGDAMAPDDEEPQELAAIGQVGLKRVSR